MGELENIRNFISALTVVIDLAFTFVFLGVMFYSSPALTWIVVGSFPSYGALSAGVTSIFRKRLDVKFDRGAENQAFLVESVTAIQTLKAIAIEPQMQRRCEKQLAGYVGPASTCSRSVALWCAHPSANDIRATEMTDGAQTHPYRPNPASNHRTSPPRSCACGQDQPSAR